MPLSFGGRSEDAQRSWQAPSMWARPSDRLAWCRDMKQTGEQWVESQSSYSDIPKAIDIISGRNDIRTSETRSGINTARLKRDVREVIGSLCNIRPFWGFSSESSMYTQYAAMMNKVARAVYLESFFDRALKGALQFSLITGDGYIWPKANRSMYGRGPMRIKFDYLGELDVLPVQMPRDNDLQEAYLVTICDFVPVARAHAMFPLFQDKLKPIAKRRYRGTTQAGRRMTLAERFRFGSRRDSFQELYCDINYQYIMDCSINTTGTKLKMGQEGTTWYYEVPSVGDDIDARDPLTGRVHRRKARAEDCYVYPYRRVMVFNDDALLYDGPNWDWHGDLPLARFSLDRWVIEGSGQVLLRDGYEYQHAINELERNAQTVANSRLRPALTYDIGAGGSVNSQTAEGLDPFAPDGRVGVDTSGGSDKPAFGTVVPEDLLTVPEFVFNLLNRYDQGIDYQMGLGQIQALAKLRANVGSDSIDKLMESGQGPIVQDISRDMEMPLQQLGNMTKYLILQYMTTNRIMQYVGEDGITAEIFDYDPESLVPSHMPGEVEKFKSAEPSDTPRIIRARHFAENLRFMITPYSVHEITQMQKKLGMIQLKKAGVWISSKTIAETWNVPNYGDVGGNTEIERYWAEKELELEHAAKLKAIGEALLGGGAGAGGGVPGAGGGNPVGRPNTFTSPPALKTKDGGERSTIATSK
jgi:hypothetical protein